MILKNSFLASLVENGKRRLWLLVVSLLAFVIAIPTYTAMNLSIISGRHEVVVQQLEDIVNIYRGNAMKIIRDKLPQLQEMDYRLMCYWCVGFSAKAISIFTGDSTNNIYVKKSRIKKEVLKLDKKTKDFVISAIYSYYIH